MRLLSNTVVRMAVAMIAAVAMLFTGVNITPIASAADGTYNPNAPAVEVTSGVTVSVFKDANHTQKFDPNKDTVKVGGTLYGTVDFDFSDAQRPTIDSPNRSYTFPENIIVKDRKPSVLYDKDGNEAGTWAIEDGVVTARWNEDWLKTHPSDISSYVSFDFTLGKDAGGDNGKEDVTFPGGGGDITITIDKSKVSGKKAYEVNDDGTVTFTVTLKPQFAVKHMIVTDTMGSNFTFVNGSFQLDGEPVSAKIDGQKATIDLGDLDAADKNGYRLTYKAQLTDAAKQKLANGEKLDDAQNTANWTWDGADQPGEADVTPNLSYKMVQKSNGSGTNSDIKWSVKLNTGSLKTDMGNYVFKDSIKEGQHYTGSYTVKDSEGNTVATGALDGSAKDFSYTFPADAGAQQYTIEYHTALDDASSTAKVNNHAEVTPPDEHHPGGSDDGSYTPGDSTEYIHKQLDSSASTNDQGRATWTSTIYTSRMPANTDPTSLQFADNTGSDDNVNSKPEGATFEFEGKPTFTLNGKTLVEGEDYQYTRDFTKTSFNVQFMGNTVKAAFGKSDITVTYATICSKEPGNYVNRSVVKFGDHPQQGYNATDTIEKTNFVSKTGSMTWDKDFNWSTIDAKDTTKGAWVAKWTVEVNKGDNGIGKFDTLGKPITVTDTLPQGMSYVPGSGKYTVKAGNKPGSQSGKLDDVVTNANGTLTFTIPTDGVKQQDGSDKAYAKLTYSTAAKGSGSEVTFTNKAAADSGSIHFGEDTRTVTGSHDVIDKSAAQVKDLNRVRYTIKVNPEGVDLIKNADTVTLSDVMDPEGTFLPASLKVTDSNTGATLVVPVSVEDVTVDGKPSTKLTLTLPDSTPITVTYDVTPNGKPGDKVNLKNTATLEGVAGGESINDKNWNVSNSSSGTEGAAGSISITKTDAADLSRHLAGAKFALYQVDMGKLSGTNVAFDQVRAAAKQVGGEVTTDANGVATFGSADNPLATNTLYYFVETAAPTATNGTAYELDPAPRYFMLPGTDATEAATALAKARDFGLAVSDGTSFNVYDKRKPAAAQGSVTLYKQLTGRAWKDSDAFTFDLAPDAANSKGVDEAALKAAMPKGTTATVKKTGDGADGSVSPFTFRDFTFAKAGTYAYTVKETGTSGDGVTVDGRTAKVTFTVEQNASGKLEIKGGQAKVEGIDENHGEWTFDNTYKPTETKVSGSIKVKKTLAGREWRNGDSFEFRLQPAAPTKDAPLPAGATGGYAKLDVTDSNEHAFGDITYDRAGEYHYTVFEHTPTANDGGSAIPGIDYSNALYNVVVTIKDDGNGKLSNGGVTMTKAIDDNGDKVSGAATAVSDNVAAVTNTYKAQEANFGLLVTKKYADETGSKPLTAGMFSFTLTAQNGAPLPNGVTGDSATASVAKDGTASFGTIKLTSDRDNGKTYMYTLKENVPADAVKSTDGKTATLNGMTYDLTTYTVQVPVKETADEDGKQVLGYTVNVLDAQGNKLDASKLDSGRPVFSNTYGLTPAEASVAGQKTLAGRDMDPDETFTFRLAAASDNTDAAKAARAGLKDHSIMFGSDKNATNMKQTVANAKDSRPAAFSFNGLHFTKPGTFKFAVTETGNVKTGTQKDEHVANATITVVDDGHGGLKVEPVTYDNSTAKTDGDKALTDKVGFTNVYAPTGYTFFLLHKKITAADGVAAPALKADEFTFGLYQGDGTDGKTPIQTKTNIAPTAGEVSGRITFDRIDYTPASLNQAVKDGYATYDAAARTWSLTYTVAEFGPDSETPAKAGDAKDGISYDASTRKVEVTVRDTGSGALQTSYKVSDNDPSTSDDADSEEAAFDNVYTPTSATAELHAKKALTGRDWKAGDRFDFKLEAVSGTFADKSAVAKADIPMPEGSQNGELIHAATNGDEFGFGQMTYTKAGTYVYTISEVQPSAADAIPGVSYSSDMYRATVTVTDDGTGKLAAKTAMELVSKVDPGEKQAKAVKTDSAAGDQVATITNTYAKLSQNWSPKVYKSYTDLSGGNPLTAGKFQFTLTPVDGAPLHVADADGTVKDATSLTAKNADNGEAAFQDVRFTDADLGANGTSKTYRYQIAEVKGSETGMTYDTAVYTVDVTIALDGNGYLTVTPAFKNKNGNPVDASKLNNGRPVFSNTFTPQGNTPTAKLKARKTLTGAALKAGQFSFKLAGVTGTEPMPTNDIVTNDTNGDAVFGAIAYNKVGTYPYTITEVVPAGGVKNGVTYDTSTHNVTVTVTLDKATGKLSATVSYKHDGDAKSDSAQFTNTYAPGSTADHFDFVKRLEGRDLKDGEFGFELTGRDGAPMPADARNGKLVVRNAADGTVAFGNIAYAKPGTYTYDVRELKGDLANVTYSGVRYVVTVTVKDNGDGMLTATHVITKDGKPVEDADAVFVNTYTPPSTPPDTPPTTPPTPPDTPPTTPPTPPDTPPTNPPTPPDTPPTTPPTPDQPHTPDTPQTPEQPTKPTPPTKVWKTLSKTGAAVSLIAALGALLLGGGLAMLTIRRRRVDGSAADGSPHGHHAR